MLARKRPALLGERAVFLWGGAAGPGYFCAMPLFAPKYLAAHPFDLDHLPDVDRRVTQLREWQAGLRSGRVHKAKEERHAVVARGRGHEGAGRPAGAECGQEI